MRSSTRSGPANQINGLYKTELIKPRGPWRTIDQVEVSTLEWVDWFNHRRINSYCADIPPSEHEAPYYGQYRTQKITEFANP